MPEPTSFFGWKQPSDRLVYRAVAIDIDGTLLNDEKEVSVANWQALADFHAAGGIVILNSGRLPVSVRWHAELLGLDAQFVAMNGAYIGQGRQMLFGQSFLTESVLAFLALCRERQLYCHIYTQSDMYFDTPGRWNENWTVRNFAWLAGQPRDSAHLWADPGVCLGRQVENLTDFVRNSNPAIYKLAVFSDCSLAEEWRAFEAIPGVTVSSSDVSLNLEMAPAGVSKGSSLLQVADLLGLGADQIIAIGDNYNDISMLQAAGLGVAMGNAPAAVRRQAQQVTGSNNQSGVAEALARWAYVR